MNKTNIEYLCFTYNPMSGCTKISPGCLNCWAERTAVRFKGRFGYSEDAPFELTLHAGRFGQPKTVRERARIGVCFMGDLFHDRTPVDWVQRIVADCLEAPWHDYLFLTKRPANMVRFFSRFQEIPNNFWLGITAEDQKNLNERTAILASLAAPVRWVSIEPMLEPVSFELTDYNVSDVFRWVVCGAETGRGKRIMLQAWARKVRDECEAAGVPFFFKVDSEGDRRLDGARYEDYPLIVR